jgi:hypothetical protein
VLSAARKDRAAAGAGRTRPTGLSSRARIGRLDARLSRRGSRAGDRRGGIRNGSWSDRTDTFAALLA